MQSNRPVSLIAGLSRDPLRHEEAMLSDWFRTRFGDRSRGG